jgi:hypothetical protein
MSGQRPGESIVSRRWPFLLFVWAGRSPPHAAANPSFVASKQGVDPGFDPVLNHMNYVYTPCQHKKGRFTAGQMATMVSKFGTCTFLC